VCVCGLFTLEYEQRECIIENLDKIETTADWMEGRLGQLSAGSKQQGSFKT